VVGPVAAYWGVLDSSSQCALVVDPDDPETVASKLDTFVGEMLGHREQIRSRCRELAAGHLSTWRFSAALQKALQETAVPEVDGLNEAA
jgi:hypothetical protein